MMVRADSPTAPNLTHALRHIVLTNFRSYEFWRGRITGDVIAVSGPNGSGKTNLLEAISLLHARQGLRYAPAAHWPRQAGSGDWAVAVELMHGETSYRLGTGVMLPGRRQYRLDGAPIAAQELAALTPQLWLTPASERFFSDDKGMRRRFLDRFAGLLHSAHTMHMRAYDKLMRDRLQLLRQPTADTSWLTSLESAMAEHGVTIAQARLDGLDSLMTGLAQFDFGAFPKAEPNILGVLEHDVRALGLAQAQDKFTKDLAQARKPDAQNGMTTCGPHRSDFQLWHAARNQPAALCSTGEQKALLVGILLAQAQILCARLPTRPILLLDEVLTHLDQSRRAQLVHLLDALQCQSWITTNEAKDVALFANAALQVQALDLVTLSETGP